MHGRTMLKSHSLYWRLSGFYLFYFATLGAFIPYWNLYLQSLAFNPAEIGELTAIVVATRMFSPAIWGWLADRSGCRVPLIRLASLLSVICFASVFVSQHYWWLAIAMFLFSFFWNAGIPQVDAMTLSFLGENTHRYGHIRLWGSVGSIITVISLGRLLEIESITLLPVIMLVLFLAIWFVSLTIPKQEISRQSHSDESLLAVLRRPYVIALLAACFLIQIGHGPYLTFYSIYLENTGYSHALISNLWALGMAIEIIVLLSMPRLLKYFTLQQLFLTGLLLPIISWLLLAYYVDYLMILVCAKLLYATGLGICNVSAIQLIHCWFTGRLQGQGQALFLVVSFGAGMMIGSLLSGYLWDMLGPSVTFTLAAGTAGVAFCSAWLGMVKSKQGNKLVLP